MAPANDDPDDESVRPVARRHRVVTPTVLQLEAVECGAAALAIVLAYHGRWVPLHELRLRCGVSRDGTKASNILKVAREYGCTARGFRKDVGELAELPLPFIVFWNFNHFLVVEGLSAEIVWLNDPAEGRRTVTWEEFDESFTGVVLTIEPTDEFERGGERPGALRELIANLWPHKAAFAFLIAVGLTLVLPGLAIPAFSQIFVDDYLIGRQHRWLLAIVLGLAFVALLRAGLSALEKHVLLRARSTIATTTASKVFWQLLRLPVEYYTQRYAGEVGSRVAICDRMARVAASELPAAALSIVVALFFFVVMLLYDATLAFLSLAFAVGNLWLLRLVAERQKSMNQRLAVSEGKVVGTTMTGLMLIETIKASGAESDFFETWAGHQARLLNSAQDMARAAMTVEALPSALSAAQIALILGVGGYRVMEGALTLGMLVAFQSLAQSFSSPVQRLVDLGSRTQQMRGDLDRLDDVLRAASEQTAPEEPQRASPGRVQGRIELRNVAFGYSRSGSALVSDVSMTIEPGQRVALLGASGSGKSTIARLIMGLYQPWAGQVLIDGRPRAEWNRDQLALSLGYVDQDIILFEGTIRENLTLWDESISDAAVVRAAQDACMHDAILQRPSGYESRLGEGGRNFSGGERQRLEIARALALEPRILVLDEAMSALDPVLEQRIDENLRRRGCTTVLVAHRLSTVRDADRIYVLEAGAIAESGTHDELMAKSGGLYRRLVSSE